MFVFSMANIRRTVKRFGDYTMMASSAKMSSMQLWKIYWFVRFVDKEIKEDTRLGRKSFLVGEYARRHKKTEAHIEALCRIAVDRKYLNEYPDTVNAGMRLELNSEKGLDLLEGGWFPYGLVIEWVKRLSPLGVAVGILGLVYSMMSYLAHWVSIQTFL